MDCVDEGLFDTDKGRGSTGWDKALVEGMIDKWDADVSLGWDWIFHLW